MKKINFGIIGCGMISNFHAKAIQEVGSIVYGAYTAFETEAAEFSKKYGAKIYDTLEDMLSDKIIDVVSICTPSGLHAEQAIMAIKAGKHVVVEKPMSLNLEDADRIITLAKEKNVKVCVISQFRFSAAVQEVRRAMEAGAFGTIVSASLAMKYYRSNEYYSSADWRGTWKMDGGGALMNQGIHGIDVLQYMLGPIKKLSAITKTQTRKIEVEDSAVAVVEFKNGAVGTIEGSTTCYPGYPRRFEICGEKGSVILEEDSIISWDLEIPCNLPVGKRAEDVASSDPKAINNEGHIKQIRNVINSILYDESLLVDASEGRKPLAIILGIYESGKSGNSVEVG